MCRLQTFQVFPDIPEKLSFLEVLSRNLWWCWHLDAIELFRRIDPRTWQKSGRNPIVFSNMIAQERLVELSKDDSFLAHLARVQVVFEEQTRADANKEVTAPNGTIAYFSMEFGIHESLPLSAGGLGILAGDHLKAASDRCAPLVAVGLLYKNGYFHQYLDQNGWQQEEYPEVDLFHLPVERVRDESGEGLEISVTGPEGEIRAVAWQVNVGCVSLILLDTNLQENPPFARELTRRLYPGETRIRLAQEVLLGVGGMRALKAMGVFPHVCHLNEGHCAFVGLERLAQLMEKYQMDVDTAIQVAARTAVFTTHTPVAAGHDEFPAGMIFPCLHPFEKRLGVDVRTILSWGQAPGAPADAPLSMFIFGLKFARECNGVSALHGQVARNMWAHLWPGWPKDEIPISHVTNGIHIPSWISIENNLLFERYIGPDWYMNTTRPEIVRRVDEIYDEELWRAHEMSRARLIRICRSLMVKQYGRRNAPKSAMEEAATVLDQDILTIAFARRFATYKRAHLLLMDPERLKAMLTSPTMPVQLVFAGKAHPKDNEGKDLIKKVVAFARQPEIRNRVVFLEDYDINIARHVVQGADIWLNTPRRPMEACGTSGMKAAVNGVLNLSVLDGWWCEGYSSERGWRIGQGEDYVDPAYQDAVESRALYNVLENEVLPAFYDRKNGDAPFRWIKMMKASMKMIMSNFCAVGMLDRYSSKYYLPAFEQFNALVEENAQKAKGHHDRQKRLTGLWSKISVENPKAEISGPFRVGDQVKIATRVDLGEIRPEEVSVQVYYGTVKSLDELNKSHFLPMAVEQELENGAYQYARHIDCDKSGRFGFTVRVVPAGDNHLMYTPGLLTWAK